MYSQQMTYAQGIILDRIRQKAYMCQQNSEYQHTDYYEEYYDTDYNDCHGDYYDADVAS